MSLPRINAHWLLDKDTQVVLRALAASGHQVRAVGGALRNELLGVPVADVDLAITALPTDVLELAQNAGLRVIPTGLKHGTLTVISGDRRFEVTTLRRDISTDGRHAEVAFTDDWKADASRRDFTINALYCNADGEVFDPLGTGIVDLEARRVRFIGDARARIEEDYLRILRFFRFFAYFDDAEPDQAGLIACVRGREGLRRLSAERVRQELIKIVRAPRASETVGVMFDHGILTELLPIAPCLKRFERLVNADTSQDAMLRLAALTIHVLEDAQRVSERLKLSKAEGKILRLAASQVCRELDIDDESQLRRLLYNLGTEAFGQCVLMAYARRQDSALERALDLPNRWTPPVFPLIGRDLLSRGFVPGPEIGRLLRRLEAGWIARDFIDDRQALVRELDELINTNRN